MILIKLLSSLVTLKLLLDNNIWMKSLTVHCQEDQTRKLTTTETFNSFWRKVRVGCSYSNPYLIKITLKKKRKKERRKKKKSKNLLEYNKLSVKRRI